MLRNSALHEKVLKGSFTVLSLAFLGSIFAYFVRILLSHSLSVEKYGLFYAVFGLFSIAIAYADLGFGYSVVYFFPKYIKLKNYSKAWNIFLICQAISLAVSVVFSFFLIILAPFLAKNYFKEADSEILIYIFCVFLIAFVIINGLLQVYSGLQKERYYASITVLRWFLTLIFLVVFLSLGFSNIIFYAIAWALGHMLTSIFFLFLLFYKHPFLTQNKIKLEKSNLGQMFMFAFPSLIETLVSSVVPLSDTFFLTLFKGVRAVGIYNIIYPLAFIPVVLISPINTLLLPLVSHLMEGEKQKIGYLMEKILMIIPFVGVYFALFVMMFPSSTVGFIFGKKWLGLVEIQLIILSGGAISILMNGILGAIILGMGKVREKLRIAAFISIITIIFDIVLIWYYGIIGVVITTSLSNLILNLLLIRIIKGVIFFKIPYLFYIKLLFFSVLFYLFAFLIKADPKNWPEFIILGVIYTIIYMFFGLILGILNRNLAMMILSRKTWDSKL